LSAQLALGLDFGTESVRALLLDLETGREVGGSSSAYRNGVLSQELPGGRRLPAEWALQDPADWLGSLELAVREALAAAAASPEAVVGVGVDFTSCTVLPTTADGTPLCRLDGWADEPHAWPKLWKHHAAQSQADELTELAAHRNESWLARYGGRVSAEWLVPKAAQIVDEAPGAYAAAERIVEAGDWVVWQLCGTLMRNSCAAGFKGLWHKRDGYPSEGFLRELRPELADLFADRAGGRIAVPGDAVGPLRGEWARRLGLSTSVTVAAAIIDAHAGLLGAGVAEPDSLYLATGTSTCHLLLALSEQPVAGISGVVEDGILQGAYAYEAGQASVGDMFEWFSRLVGRSHADLTAAAAELRPGESGLLALDWWNGCRTPLMDADLSGVLLGVTLATPPEAVYRALLEASAFGTRLVVETFAAAGIAIDRLVIGGGLASNELMLQIYADVTGLPVDVVASRQPSARGAAVLAAAASGAFTDVRAAATATARPAAFVVEPEPSAHAGYGELYALYRELVVSFGPQGSPLKRLSTLRRRAVSEQQHVTRLLMSLEELR
jgi:L-ribulokinase